MQSTNVNTPVSPPATTAKVVAGAGHTVSTSGTYQTGQRTVAVNATQGKVALRYAPVNPKSTPQSTR